MPDLRTKAGREAAGLPPLDHQRRKRREPDAPASGPTVNKPRYDQAEIDTKRMPAWRMRHDIESVAMRLGQEKLFELAVEDPKWFYEKLAIRLLPKIVEGGDEALQVHIVHEVVSD